MNIVDPKYDTTESKEPVQRWEYSEPHCGGKKALWAVVVLMLLALGGLGYYGYTALQQQNAQVAQLSGTQATISAMGQRVDAAEKKLHDWTGGWDGLVSRVSKLEANANHNLTAARKYARDLTDQLHQQVRGEMDARVRPLDARLHQVESQQATENARLQEMETQLRREITAARQEGRETAGDLNNVHQQFGENARNLDTLNQRLDRRRVDFELAKGRTQELVPGISLEVNKTNVSQQRFGGWLWVLPEHKTVWLRNQVVHQSVRFYHKQGGEPYELVVTDVTKRFVIGYLLTPVREQVASAPSTAGQTEVATAEPR